MHKQTKFSVHQVKELADRILRLYYDKSKSNENYRVVISLAGIPGSGKTTLSDELMKLLNNEVKSIVLPQDGFHYYRSDLIKMPNPEEAVFRRGAPFTFNVEKYVELISDLRDANKDTKAPSFDHSLKDPVENDILIDKDTKIVILEGNYLSLRDPYWSDIEKYVDEAWFVDIPLELARERLIRRHVETGVTANETDATARVDGTDLLNAKYILQNSKNADLLIITR